MPRPPSGEDWPFAPPYMFLSPGYRIEALLDGRALQHGDTLCVMAARHLNDDGSGITDQPVGFTEPPTVDQILQILGNADLLAIVNVTEAAGPPTGTEMPDLAAVAEHSPSMMLQDGSVNALERCEEVQAIVDVDDIDQLAVMWAVLRNPEGFDACGCPDHNLNCKNFELTDRDRYPYDRVLTKGRVDHWRLKAGFDGHPFHIHINPYLVCPLPPEGSEHPNTKGRLFETPFAHWRDTYLVNLDRQADLLIEYRAFTGDFVYHCHKLNHEDHGMMELITVCDPALDDCDTKCSGGPCGWQHCAEGDTSCERALSTTKCVMNRDKCADTLARCTPCSPQGECPAATYCADEADPDGVVRCVPGCREDADCAPVDACRDGACAPAPCAGPCPPGQRCTHGACR